MTIPPAAPPRPFTSTLHGVARVDRYHWLRDREDPEVLAYLAAENQYADALLAPLAALYADLETEARTRLREVDISAPIPHGEFVYYSRTIAGGAYPLICRAPRALPTAEQVLLDGNALAVGHSFFGFGPIAISPDHRRLAYATDTRGDERFDLVVLDLTSMQPIGTPITNTGFSLAWANNSTTLFYTTFDASWRSATLYRTTVGETAPPVVVHEEADDRFNLYVQRSRDDAYLFVTSGSSTTTEVWGVPADTPITPPQRLIPRVAGVEHDVGHRAGYLYTRTNDQAQTFRLRRAPIANPTAWEDVVPARIDVTLDGFDLFVEYMVVYGNHAGVPQAHVTELTTGDTHTITFDDPNYMLRWHRLNHEYETTTLYLRYSSLVTPETVYAYEMDSRARTTIKVDTPHGYDATRYTGERVFASAPDGTQVPISLVYRTDLRRAGGNPTLILGYGAYGAELEAQFYEQAIPLLDRGIMVSLAHVRGGGDMGRAWYDAGKLHQKQHSFDDLIACAEYLGQHGYADPARIAIEGRSAGGLLVAAAMTQRPELFCAVLAGVPFVDVINTMMDSSLPLTAGEFEEWGDPNDPRAFAYMLAYSPYDNVTMRQYPALFTTAGLHDARVQYWEPAKWVARLRAESGSHAPIILRTMMEGGHGGPSGRYANLVQRAEQDAWLLDRLTGR